MCGVGPSVPTETGCVVEKREELRTEKKKKRTTGYVE